LIKFKDGEIPDKYNTYEFKKWCWDTYWVEFTWSLDKKYIKLKGTESFIYQSMYELARVFESIIL
jgi:hypothetical protein